MSFFHIQEELIHLLFLFKNFATSLPHLHLYICVPGRCLVGIIHKLESCHPLTVYNLHSLVQLAQLRRGIDQSQSVSLTAIIPIDPGSLASTS